MSDTSERMDAITFLKQHYNLSKDESWVDAGTSIKIDKVRNLMEAYARYVKSQRLDKLKEKVEGVFDKKYKEYQELTADKKFEKAYERWIQTEQIKDVLQLISELE